MTFAIIAIAIVLFASDWLELELVSLGTIVAFLLLFHFLPLLDEAGNSLLSPQDLLSGFANTALLTILALLVVGQGLHQSGALDGVTQILSTARRSRAKIIIWLCLISAGIMSAFLNNTPVVVMFIPIVAALANRYGPGAGRMLMPLSFITILGGMVTLVGSSTNLLVAGMVEIETSIKIEFFDFFMPGIILALIGSVYVLLVVPLMLNRPSLKIKKHKFRSGVQFLARVELHSGHKLLGEVSRGGLFPSLKEVTVRLVKRGEKIILPPFEDITLREHDIVQFAGTREQVTELVEFDASGEHLMLAEAAIAPASRLGGRNIVDEEFTDQTGCYIIGIQRHKRMKRDLRNKIRLRPGDVFLIGGTRTNIRKLRLDRDLMLLEGSVSTINSFAKANYAFGIFATTVLAAALGLVPIVVAAIIGALAMILSGCLNIGQAGRAIDRRIVLLIAASITMAAALDKTGGAAFLANGMVDQLSDFGPVVILSALFLTIAVLTNLLSNNATALLFTPIAINIAQSLEMSPIPFIHAVIFAANCSFASPLGYQTNLLVMGPGNYRFMDFVKAGGPLVIIIWLSFTALAPWYYSI
ncbi:MAG: SLC13 family permease [Rhizobiaceae bacterium]|nr:SLC13 family permease [Rhizobiaceae bacterium]